MIVTLLEILIRKVPIGVKPPFHRNMWKCNRVPSGNVINLLSRFEFHQIAHNLKCFLFSNAFSYMNLLLFSGIAFSSSIKTPGILLF